MLIDCGATVDVADSDEATPLHLAAESNGRAVAEVLLRAGAATDARRRFGYTPLHRASMEGALGTARIPI